MEIMGSVMKVVYNGCEDKSEYITQCFTVGKVYDAKVTEIGIFRNGVDVVDDHGEVWLINADGDDFSICK